MNYLDNLKTYDRLGRRSIYETLSLNPNIPQDWEIISREYEAVDIDKVYIDENCFTNYGQYQFIWEKTFVKEPKRGGRGNLGNLNSYTTFLTPHLIIDFSVMPIDDYRAIMKLHYERNEYTVKCYDIIYNRPIKVKMYFATEQMAKLYTINKTRLKGNGEWEDFIMLAGVKEYSVELIGTNNELDLISVFYNYNAPLDESGLPIYPNGSPIPNEAEEDVYMGEEIVVGANSTFPDMPPSSKYRFKHWVDKDGTIYSNGKVLTVNAEMTLYAVWESSNTYNLSFNYGLSKPMTEINSATSVITEVINREITNINDIGVLPTFDVSPYVEDSNTKVKYYPYENGGWYKHPIKDESLRVVSNQPYWQTRDTIIYCLYDKKKFSVNYITNDTNTAIPQQSVEYGGTVYLPNLYRSGYTFQGWYINSAFTKQFSGAMPPYNITLYAKWGKNDK